MQKRQLQTAHLGVSELIENTKRFITKNDCPFMSMDVSHLNILDAVKATILCSTYHYAKYPQGKMDWFVNSNEVKNLAKPLCLGNVNLILAGR